MLVLDTPELINEHSAGNGNQMSPEERTIVGCYELKSMIHKLQNKDSQCVNGTIMVGAKSDEASGLDNCAYPLFVEDAVEIGNENEQSIGNPLFLGMLDNKWTNCYVALSRSSRIERQLQTTGERAPAKVYILHT